MEENKLSEGYWDIHNHILPGLDDGSGSIEETIELLSLAYEQGIRHIVFTPHYREKMFEVSPNERVQVFEEVSEQVRTLFPDLELFLGCEYHIGRTTERDIQEPRFCMAQQKIILAEFSFTASFQYISQSVQQIQNLGYQVIVAHPERYNCLRENMDYMQKLHDCGVILQVNADSILGYCGLRMKHYCKKLLKADLVDVIASDTHDLKYRPMLLGQCAELIRRKYGNQRAERLFRETPQKLICSERN